MADLTYNNNNNDIAEGVTGAVTKIAGVHASQMLYADDLTMLTNDPRDMQIMLSWLAVYTRNKHLIVKSGVLFFCRQAGSPLARCLRFTCIF